MGVNKGLALIMHLKFLMLHTTIVEFGWILVMEIILFVMFKAEHAPVPITKMLSKYLILILAPLGYPLVFPIQPKQPV